MMAKLNFQHHYSSLRSHMIRQKSLSYADLALKIHFLLMLKTFVLFNNFVETDTFFINQENWFFFKLLLSIQFHSAEFSLG